MRWVARNTAGHVLGVLDAPDADAALAEARSRWGWRVVSVAPLPRRGVA